MVSMDIYLNETTRHADVILPSVSTLEDFHYDVAFPQLSWRHHARYSTPVLRAALGQPEEWQTVDKVRLAPPSLLQDLQRAVHDLRGLAPDSVIIGRRDVHTNNRWMHNLHGAQLHLAAERPGANLNALLDGVAITMQAVV